VATAGYLLISAVPMTLVKSANVTAYTTAGITLRRTIMLNTNKLIIAATLLGLAAMGSTSASAQSFGNNRAHATARGYYTNDAYRGNVDQQTYEIQKWGYEGP
jgi:hypothetical protein